MRTTRIGLILSLLSVMTAGAMDRNDPMSPPTINLLAQLTASDGTYVDYFGQSVAISGNTVVVGAPYKQVGSNQGQGAAYVFVKPSNGWSNMTQVAELSPSDGTAYLNFGFSVAISGNTIVVGSVNSAYVFGMPSGGWKNMTQTAELYDSNSAYSVAISGTVVVVGAPGTKVGSNLGAGAAFVFVEPKGGWVSTDNYAAELTASDESHAASFGHSVAISGTTIVVGAPFANVGTTGSGDAYVFVKPTNGWKTATETGKLTPSDGLSADYYGWSVAITGSTVVVGAPNHPSSGSVGAAYVFTKPATGWTTTTAQPNLQLTEPDQQQTANNFGVSVAISGGTIVAGDPFFALINTPGIVYVF